MNLLNNQREADVVAGYYQDLEEQLMRNIVRHIQGYEQPIPSDEWQLQKLAEIGSLNRENMRIIARNAGISHTAAERMLNQMAEDTLEKLEPGFQELAKRGLVDAAVSVTKSRNVNQTMKALRKQASDTLNACNTTMLYKARDAFDGLVKDIALSLQKEGLDILSKSAVSVVLGAESRQQVVRRCIRVFNDKGITAFVDKRGRNWTPEAYVNMAMRATAGSVAHEVEMARCDDYGINLVEVSRHSGARPKCARDQGKIFDRTNKSDKYPHWNTSSYGAPDGLLGINCRHHIYPFIEGVSVRRYFPMSEEELAANDELYKQTQVQRALERSVRHQKRECMLLDAIGDKEGFELASVKLKAKEAQLKAYVADHSELHRRRDREQVVGFDKHVSTSAVAANKAYTKAQKTDTISVKDTVIHKSVGAKSRNYKVVNKATGVEYEFAPGSHIQNSEVFAGKGTRHPLHEGVAEGLTEQYGGVVSKWQHAKGIGVLVDQKTGEEFRAEVHWFQEETVGKVQFKLKKELEDES